MAMGGGIFLWGSDGTASASTAAADPVTWRAKQRGHVDLFVNIAIAAATAVVVARAPTYVNRSAPRWTQVEQTQNRAVFAPRALVPMVEPDARRRPWTQPDLYPNLAARATAASAPAALLADPTAYRKAPRAPDLFPNIAGAQPEVTALTRAPFFMAYRQARFTQVEHARNLAALQPAPAALRAAPQDDPMGYRRIAQPPYLFPNLAAQQTAPATLRPQQLDDPVRYRRVPQPPELLPNIAVLTDLDVFIISSDDALTARRWTQPDFFPNLSVSASAQAPRVVPTMLDPTSMRRFPLLSDLYPNLAVNATAQASRVPPAAPEPAIMRRWAAVDLYPNIALSFTASYVTPAPVEPTASRQRWQQPDAFPNIAARAAETNRVPPAMLQPPPAIRFAPQVELYPNVAIGYTAPTVVYDVRIRIGVSDGPHVAVGVAPHIGVDPPFIVIGVYS